MLRNIDRHGSQREKNLKVGDRVRLPIDDLVHPRNGVYRHTFEIVAFGGVSTSRCGPKDGSRPQWIERNDRTHTVIVRRIADGWVGQISAHFVTRYREEIGEDYLDSSVGNKNVRRLALMRGDLKQCLYSMHVEIYYFEQAQFNKRERAREAKYGTGYYSSGRLAFTVRDDSSNWKAA